MRPYWIRVGSYSNMIGVLVRRGKIGYRHTGEKGTKWWRQRLECCTFKPRNKHCQKTPEAGKRQGFSPKPSERAWPSQHLDFRLVGSRTMKGQIMVVINFPHLCYFLPQTWKLIQPCPSFRTRGSALRLTRERRGPGKQVQKIRPQAREEPWGQLCAHSWVNKAHQGGRDEMPRPRRVPGGLRIDPWIQQWAGHWQGQLWWTEGMKVCVEVV